MMARAWFGSHPTLARTMLAVILLGISGPHRVPAVEMPASYFREISVSSMLVSGGEPVRTCSSVHCILACKSSPTCRGACYSWSTSKCYQSEEYSPGSPQELTGTEAPDLICYTSRNCPLTEGYAVHASHCIKLYPTAEDYPTAKGTCENDGGHLYHYKSRDWDMPPIMKLYPNSGIPYLWVGADKLSTPPSYTWSDGAPLDRNAPVWDNNEPSDYGGSTESCVHLWRDYMLNDLSCTIKNAFVCQIDL